MTSSQGRMGVTINCSIVPRSRSRTNRGRGQDGGDRIQDHADHTRDHEIRADQVGVVPHIRAHL